MEDMQQHMPQQQHMMVITVSNLVSIRPSPFFSYFSYISYLNYRNNTTEKKGCQPLFFIFLFPLDLKTVQLIGFHKAARFPVQEPDLLDQAVAVYPGRHDFFPAVHKDLNG